MELLKNKIPVRGRKPPQTHGRNEYKTFSVEKQNPRKGTETMNYGRTFDVPLPEVEKQNPRKGTETPAMP